jgi:hypothetical protein
LNSSRFNLPSTFGVRSSKFLAIAVALLLWGVATHSTHAGSGDEPHYLAIAHSLAFDFDFDVSNNYGADEPLIANGGLTADAHVRPGVDGRARPVHDVGLPILLSPYVRLARPLAAWSIPHASGGVMRRLRLTPTTLYRHLLSAAMILIGAWLAVLMARTFTDMGTPPTAAFLTALLVSASPPFLVMSLLFFTEVPSALVALFAFRILTADDSRPSEWPWFIAGSLLGLLLLIHIRNVGIVIGLLGVAAWHWRRTRSWRPVVAAGAGLIALAAVRAGINHMFWGSWWTSPHATPGAWTGFADALDVMAQRAGGLLLDQEYGLVPYAPVFILAPMGLIRLAKTQPATAGAVAVVLASYIAFILFPVTNVHGWTGGWSPAGRFLTPILPLAAIGIAVSIGSLPRIVTVPLIVLQVGISAYFWQNPKNLWNDADGVAAVCARGGFTVCERLPSFVTPDDRRPAR